MCLRFVSFFCMMASLGLADTLTMRDGKVITGSYLGGDSRTIRMAVGDRVETYSVDDVSMLQFSSKAGSTATPPARPAETGRQSVFRPERPPTPATSTASGIELSAGTQLTIRMIDDVDSERDRLGQTFKASLDEPVTFGSDVAIPRGADVVVKLVEDKQSGKIQGQTVLTLDLQSVTVNGKVVDITTEEVSQSSESRGAKSGKVIGARRRWVRLSARSQAAARALRSAR